MIRNLNKEKIVFGLSLVVLLLTGYESYRKVSKSPSEELTIQGPREAQPRVVGKAILPWYELETVAKGRDPFRSVSDWQDPEPDPLSPPRLSRLKRRIPSPYPLSRIPTVAPPVEEARSEE